MTTKTRVFLAHNACLNASYDFNLVKAALKRSGYEIVGYPEAADEVLFSGCAVRGLWVEDAANQLVALHDRAPHARLIVTGCVANASAEHLQNLVGLNSLTFRSHDELLQEHADLSIAELDREVIQDESQDFEGLQNGGLTQLRQRVGPEKAAIAAELQRLDREYGTQLESYYRRTTKGFVFYNNNEPVEFVTVTRSCPYTCSFCVIPRGRGHFSSVPLNTVLDKVRSALARGVRRIVLLGDEVGNYGSGQSGPDFSDLITAVTNLHSELCLSIRYIEPSPFVRHATILRRLCESGQIELLYLSLQTGSQRILAAMNRHYDIERVSALYGSIRCDSNTIFYGNWMVGFPGESWDDYSHTVDLVRQLDMHINVVIPFSSRPNTPACSMSDQISRQEKAMRVDRLTRVAADMKAAHLAKRLEFLEEKKRELLLENVRSAEWVQYEDRTPASKLINIGVE